MKKRSIGFAAMISFVFLFSLACNAEPQDTGLDKSAVLKAEGVTGAFVLLEASLPWKNTNVATKKLVLSKVKNLTAKYAAKVIVDVYDTSGLTKGADFFLRLHSYEPDQNQQFIEDLLASHVLGPYFVLRDVRLGITKGLNYAPKLPDLLAQLKAAKYEGPPPVFGIMVTVDKTSEWWNLPEGERLEMIKEHTALTLPFIKEVQRKLYHSTGLGETDFVTYFETSSLRAFNDLIVTLKSVREGRYTTYGTPVIGRIATFDDVFK